MIISTQINAQNMAALLVSSVYPLNINTRFILSINFGNSISIENQATITYQTIINNSNIQNIYLIGGGGITMSGDLYQFTGSASVECRLQTSSGPNGVPITLNGPITITQKGIHIEMDGTCSGIIVSGNQNITIQCIIKGKTTIGNNCNIKAFTFNTGDIKLAIT